MEEIKKYKLELEKPFIDLIIKGLCELPAKESFNAINYIFKVVSDQDNFKNDKK